MNKLKEPTDKTLRALHFVAFLAHFSQSIALFTIAGIQRKALTVTNTVMIGRPGGNDTSFERDNLPIEPLFMSACFALLSALAHILPTIWWSWYVREIIEKEYDWLRWLEYSISSTIMVIQIAVTVGIVEINSLIAIGGCNVAMILFGDLSDRKNFFFNAKGATTTEMTRRRQRRIFQDKDKLEDDDETTVSLKSNNNNNDGGVLYYTKTVERDDDPWLFGLFDQRWKEFIYGCIIGLIPWICIFSAFFQSLARTGGVIWFVWTIIWSIFFQFNCFAFVAFKRISRPQTYTMRKGIFLYTILSLISKTSLNWQGFASMQA